jgi:MFS family permease
MVDPAMSARWARRAALSMAVTAVMAVGALISGLAGVTALAFVLVIVGLGSGTSGVYCANRARRLAIARRDELRREHPGL